MKQQLSTKQKIFNGVIFGIGGSALCTTALTIKSLICDKKEERRDQIYKIALEGLVMSAGITAYAVVALLTKDDEVYK